MITCMTKGITIRSVNRNLWRELKVAAVKRGMTLGEAVNFALEDWLHSQKEASAGTNRKSFWSLKPIKFEGSSKEKLSWLVDKTLYG